MLLAIWDRDWQDLAVIAGIIVGAYLIVMWIAALVWTYRDSVSRSRDSLTQTVALVLVLVFNLPGLLLYLILRPKQTLAETYDRQLEAEALLHELQEQATCPRCRRKIEQDFLACPYCRSALRIPCQSCGKGMAPTWVICAFCGADREESAPAPLRPVATESQATTAPRSRPPAPEAREHRDVHAARAGTSRRARYGAGRRQLRLADDAPGTPLPPSETLNRGTRRRTTGGRSASAHPREWRAALASVDRPRDSVRPPDNHGRREPARRCAGISVIQSWAYTARPRRAVSKGLWARRGVGRIIRATTRGPSQTRPVYSNIRSPAAEMHTSPSVRISRFDTSTQACSMSWTERRVQRDRAR